MYVISNQGLVLITFLPLPLVIDKLNATVSIKQIYLT